MYEVDAELLVRLGEFFVTLGKMFDGGLFDERPLGDPQIFWLRTNLPVMGDHCQHLQLPTAEGLVLGFYRDYKDQNPSWKETQIRMACIKETFKTELSARLCLFVHTYKSSFYISPLDGVRECDLTIQQNFPSTLNELADAGRCYAFEQNTASVFHSMRALEKGLHSLASKLGIAPKIPIVLQDWQNIIDLIEAEIRNQRALARSLHKSETLKIYSDAALEFWYFKEAWRNHVAHSRERYTDADALRVLTHVHAFMSSLASGGLREIPNTNPVTAPSA